MRMAAWTAVDAWLIAACSFSRRALLCRRGCTLCICRTFARSPAAMAANRPCSHTTAHLVQIHAIRSEKSLFSTRGACHRVLRRLKPTSAVGDAPPGRRYESDGGATNSFRVTCSENKVVIVEQTSGTSGFMMPHFIYTFCRTQQVMQ